MPHSIGAKTCLIVGAGMAGLTCARSLVSRGWSVTVVDKGRGVGGRMATRRIGEAIFDHGAQFFTVRDPAFEALVGEWLAAGVVRPWFTESGHTRYTGAAGMNTIAKWMAAGLTVHCGERIESLRHDGASWLARAESGNEYRARAAVLTAPAEQSVAMLHDADALPSAIRSSLAQVRFHRCLALLVKPGEGTRVPLPGYVRPVNGPIAWLADNRQKGISGGWASVTIHAQPDFSEERWDAPPESTAQRLLDAGEEWMGKLDTVRVEWQLHRWRYSQPATTLDQQCLFSASPAPIAFAGDAFGGPRVEGAYLSGLAAAARIADV